MHNYGANPTIPPSYIRIRAVVWTSGWGQTDRQTQTRVTNIHFASSTTHAKFNDMLQLEPTKHYTNVSSVS